MGRAAKFILEPTRLQHNAIVNSLMFSKDLVIKENRKDAIVWCMTCNTEKKVSIEMARQIKKAKICPFCFNEVKIHKRNYVRENYALVRILNNGYYYRVSKMIGRKPKAYCKQVAYWTDDGFYARNIIMSMYSWVYRSDEQIDRWNDRKGRERWKKYRKRRTGSWNSLEMQFHPIEYIDTFFENTVSKKKWLQEQILPDFKSNQKKIIIDNLLNRTQMWAVAIFDLKSVRQIYKYNAWINEQDWETGRERFNVYMLDYLYRNKISYSDYLDYIDQCRELNIKPGKPKDFYKTHSDLAKEIKIIHQAARDKQIQERAKELVAYEKDGVVIRPLNSVEDVVDTGAVLHNCIKGYIDSYADGHTDLYVL
ncbi:MAG: PcfJ domain-containing protein, partial [Erysipelotrichaceae bacterium]|nr:PcfJ domain-containing protein [Erysipelotrichaceae bacterium]